MTSTEEKTFGIQQEKFVPFDEIHLDKGGDDLTNASLPTDLDTIRPEVPQQEKSIDTVETEDDDTLLAKAEVAIERGHTDIALNFARRIHDPNKLNDLIRTAVTILVSNGDYDFARKLVSLSDDPDVFDRENQYIDGAEGKIAESEDLAEHEEDATSEFDSPQGRVVDATPYVSRRDAGKPLADFEDHSKEVVSDEDFDKFVHTGDIPGDVLVFIADRISKGEKVTERELAIQDAFGEKIELLLKNKLGEKVEAKDKNVVKVEIINKKESDEIFERVVISGDEFNGKKLTPEILKSEGLSPKYKITIGDTTYWFASSGYNMPDSRIGLVAYVQKGDGVVARSYYKSNSQGVWRYLPDYTSNGDEIMWFGKGYGEESITLPFQIQKVLSDITEDESKIINVTDPDFILVGTARKLGKSETYYSETESDPKKLNGDFYNKNKKVSPEKLNIEGDEAPDFSKVILSWEQSNSIYGRYKVQVFSSKNGKLRYMFCKDEQGRAWIGGIEDNSELQSTGLKKSWIEGGDLTTPAFEYDTQTGGYGGGHNTRSPDSSYVDMFENYLSKSPLIKEYLSSNAEEEFTGEDFKDEVTEKDKIKTSAEIAMERVARIMAEDNPPAPENTPVEPPPPPQPPTVPTPESNENIDESLSATRDEYFKQYVDWKNEIRKSKNIFGRMMMDFGVDKKLPEKPEPEALIIAKNAYVQSKAKKFRDLINKQMSVPNQDGRPLGLLETEAQAFREELLEAIENENNLFQNKFIESLPEKEKSIITRGFEKWTKISKPKRILISTSLVFGASVFGGAGVASALTYAGYRAGKSYLRSTVGTAAAQGAGKVMDMKYAEDTQVEKDKASSEFIGGINLANFAEREKKMMDYFEAKNAKDKRQILKKALVKTGIVGATALSVGIDTDKLSVPSGDPVSNHAEVVSDKVDATKEVLKNTSGIELKVEPNVIPTEVSLSSKGFIEDFRNLQANILAEYHDKMDTMPQALKDKILSKTPTQLAKDFHFYDPEHNASGVGFKGESLGIDKDGNLYYEHLDGNKQVIFDSKTGEVHPFEGQMNTPESVIAEKIQDEKEAPVDSEVSSVQEPEVITETKAEEIPSADDIVKTEIDPEETVVSSNEEAVLVGENFAPQESFPVKHIHLSDNNVVDIAETDKGNIMQFERVNIGHEEIVEGGKLMTLNDEFQDGEDNMKVRSAFVEAFEKTVNPDLIGPTPYAEPFEGGKIYISYNLPHDPDRVRILLNGKVIAEGDLVNGVPKVEIYKHLKSGLFVVDTPYERAFKHISKFIKQGLKDGSVEFAKTK